MCLNSKKCVPRLFGEFFRTPSIFQKGYLQNGRKFAVEGREIAPRPMETL